MYICICIYIYIHMYIHTYTHYYIEFNISYSNTSARRGGCRRDPGRRGSRKRALAPAT